MKNDVSLSSNLPTDLFRGITAVIFDMDGTLLDSMFMWRNIDVHFLESRGFPMRPDLQKCIEGLSMSQVADWFKEQYQLPESREEIMALWNQMAIEEYEQRIEMKPGAETLIRLLHANGIHLAIATSNSRELVEAAVRQHPVLTLLDAYATSNEVTIGKPAPDVYLYAAKQLGSAPDHCLIFEDILPGIQSGKSAGMRVCAVEDRYSEDIRQEKAALADAYAMNYADLTACYQRFLLDQ